MFLLKTKLHLLLICLAFSSAGFSQKTKEKPLPGYFQWPLAAMPAIVANYGELRPNHFHMGMDCRTDQKQNIPVLAAADGYISKIRIEPFGFGRCIYINHPGGLTTLYAHLNDFVPELEKYVTEEQYRLKSWAIFMDLPTNLFPVKKGQQIAFSGNTGGSQGPHLHFEIRDTKTDKVLNPSLFEFPIPDDVAPDIYRLAVYDRNLSTYEQNPLIYNLKKVNGVYMASPPLLVVNTDKISFGITAFDRVTGSSNRNGIYEATLYDNNDRVIAFRMDSISYDDTRYLNAHIDYKMRINGGAFVEHLSRLPGNSSGIYHPFTGDGVIRLANDSTHLVKIEVKDANGNCNTLVFAVARNSNQPKKEMTPSPYQQNIFHPGMINVFEQENISFYLPGNCLYDSFHFKYQELPPVTGYPVYRLHNNSVPLHTSFPLKIKATVPALLKDKMVIARSWNGRSDYEKAVPVSVFNQEWFLARFREFGDFQLMADTLPPAIVPVGFKDNMNCSRQSRIAFSISDNTREVMNFKATLDGNWLRFTNDKARLFIYRFDERCPPGAHELIISAEDQLGNRTEKIYHFTR